jgi:hypothetical protein
MNIIFSRNDPANDWLNFLQSGLRLLFKDHPPTWLPEVIGIGIVIATAIFMLWMFLKAAYGITSLVKEKLLPLLYDREVRRAVRNSQQFAEHLESDLRRLNGLEQWSDFRYAELEAEVEYEGLRQGIWPFTKREGITRERNLSRALLASKERLILLEGFPGTGKSVALRHLALKGLKKAMRALRLGTVTPIYINLKQLDLAIGEAPTAKHIRSFVLSTLNKPDDRDVDIYIEQTFDERVRKGSWLFLFDSFDEIPAILSATDADTTVGRYANAIADFLSGMNSCRGIIASREFKGPTQLGWPVFRILPLTKSRQHLLTDRARLSSAQENALWANLETAPQQIQEMAGNAMFLSILCEYVKTGTTFPQSVHSVFDLYIGTRLRRDSQRLVTRFAITDHRLRRFAEEIAFCMLSDASLGLSPSREALFASHLHAGFTQSQDDVVCLDALEYVKLARQESVSGGARSAHFTFAHRRFQEYFATCVVLREPERISTEDLLTDGRWRETAVALFQMQSLTHLEPLQMATDRLLRSMIRVQQPANVWPPKSLHLLSLLQDGFMARSEDLREQVRSRAGRLVMRVWRSGTTVDRKWALQNAGCISQKTLTGLIEKSLLEVGSPWIEEVAYRQVARLTAISPKISQWIKTSLIHRATSIKFFQSRSTTKAFLSRLSESNRLILAWKMMSLLYLADLVTVSIALLALFRLEKVGFPIGIEFGLFGFLVYAGFWVSSDIYDFAARLIPPLAHLRRRHVGALFWAIQPRLSVLMGMIFAFSHAQVMGREGSLYSLSNRPIFPDAEMLKRVLPSTHELFPGLGFLVLLLWNPLILWSIPYQDKLALWLVPLSPIIVFVDVTFRKWNWKYLRRLPMQAAVASVGALVTGILLYMASFYIDVVLTFVGIVVVYRLMVLYLDWRRLCKWSSTSQAHSAQTLYGALLEFKSDHYRAMFIRHLRTSNRFGGTRLQVFPA